MTTRQMGPVPRQVVRRPWENLPWEILLLEIPLLVPKVEDLSDYLMDRVGDPDQCGRSLPLLFPPWCRRVQDSEIQSLVSLQQLLQEKVLPIPLRRGSW